MLRYECNEVFLFKEDKYSKFCIYSYLITGSEESISQEKELSEDEKLDLELGELKEINKNKHLLTKIEILWSDKYIRSEKSFNDFVQKVKFHKERDIDTIRKFSTESIEIIFHKRSEQIQFWSCSGNPFIEIYFSINEELIEILTKMKEWITKNKEIHEKNPPRTLVLGGF